MKAGEVDGHLASWLAKRWKRDGKAITEISLGHCKGATPETLCVLTREILAGFNDTKEICQDLEERMSERCRWYAGRIRFEVTLFGGEHGTRVIDSTQVERKGEGRAEEEPSIEPSAMLAQYMKEARRDRELTITTLSNQIQVLERRLERQYTLIDQMFARHPELLDLMSRLADNEVEREIKRRQAYRIESLKDRALQRLDQAMPHLLMGLTGGKINLTALPQGGEGSLDIARKIEPHLGRLIKSLAASGDRGMQIIALMTEEEQREFLAIASVYEAHAAANQGQNGIKVEAKHDDPPATS